MNTLLYFSHLVGQLDCVLHIRAMNWLGLYQLYSWGPKSHTGQWRPGARLWTSGPIFGYSFQRFNTVQNKEKIQHDITNSPLNLVDSLPITRKSPTIYLTESN